MQLGGTLLLPLLAAVALGLCCNMLGEVALAASAMLLVVNAGQRLYYDQPGWVLFDTAICVGIVWLIFNVSASVTGTYKEVQDDLAAWKKDYLSCLDPAYATAKARSADTAKHCVNPLKHHDTRPFQLTLDRLRERGIMFVVCGISVSQVLNHVADSHMGYMTLFTVCGVLSIALVYLVIRAWLTLQFSPANCAPAPMPIPAPAPAPLALPAPETAGKAGWMASLTGSRGGGRVQDALPLPVTAKWKQP